MGRLRLVRWSRLRNLARRAIAVAGLLSGVAGIVPAVAADDHPGRRIYAEKCASCHGERGERTGTNEARPLAGELSLNQLAKYIEKSMPEDDPESCIGEEAQQVAEYIYDAFYSPIARMRNNPPRMETARLTVAQYRNSLADLAASFLWQGEWDERRGLDGEYYNTNRRAFRRLKGQYLKIERVDPNIDFDFGSGSADTNLIPPDQYCVHWYGGLLAPDTGVYDFIIKTPNAGRFWVNHKFTDGAAGEYGGGDPLIDAVVKTGDTDEYRQSIFLVGGRVYPIQVEFNKSTAEKVGRFQLMWKRPQGEDEVIPGRYLSPNRFNETIIVETPFPPDDRSAGYERGVSVSREWTDAMTFAAVEFADEVMAKIYEFAGLSEENSSEHETRLRKFCEQFVERAFRRPLTEEVRTQFVDQQFESANDPFVATKRVMLLTLRSPRFLFPGIDSRNFDDYRMAEWLALALWDSIPDEELRQAAAKGELKTRDQLMAQAERMVRDERARLKVKSFFQSWINDSHYQFSKSSSLFPDFNSSIAADLRTSLHLLVDDIFWSEKSSFYELLTTTDCYLNNRLAKFYDVDVEIGKDFQRVPFEPANRSGILTHPYLLSGLAYHDSSSPIHRGVFLARSLVGRRLKPPPVAVDLEPADLHPDMTTRERVERQTSSPSCFGCHGIINPLGFPLESFDAVGRFRQMERGKVVNTHVVYVDHRGQEHPLNDARELAKFLADSRETHSAFVELLFQHVVKQPIQAFEPSLHAKLTDSFVDHELNMRQLLVTIAVDSALSARDHSGSSK